MNLHKIILFVSIFISELCWSQDLFINKADQFIFGDELENATTGILIKDNQTGEIVYQFNENKSMIPGSLLKIVTSGAALEILGKDYRFRTELGYKGGYNDSTGVLSGDIVIIGGGDPVLGSSNFKNSYLKPHFLDRWVDTLMRMGIQEITGNIILDLSIYGEQIIPNTWIWEDIGNYYGAGAQGISIYDNTYTITFKSPVKSGEQTFITGIDPEIKGLELINHVISSDDNSDLAYVFGSPSGTTKIIRGTIPKGHNEFKIKASIPNPADLLTDELIEKLEKNDIFFKGVVVRKKVNEDSIKLIFEEISPKLESIIQVMNYESINLYAEHLVKQIAYEKSGKGSIEEGVRIVKEFWESKGINTEGMFLEDGSGLSHFNAITPKQIGDILKYMKSSSQYAFEFENSLPSPGQGTLIVFDPENFPGRILRCKSGSMSRVRCYAGYLKTDSGKEFDFVFMFNHFEGSHNKLISEIEKLLIDLKKEY